MKTPLSLIALIALAGCASGGHCLGEHDYQKAQNLPPPPAVEGLRQSDSSAALRIPPAPEQGAPYAETYPDPEDAAKQKVLCLDVPPRMAEPVPPPAAEPPKS